MPTNREVLLDIQKRLDAIDADLLHGTLSPQDAGVRITAELNRLTEVLLKSLGRDQACD